MEPLGVHHVSINVVDVAEAIGFYTDVLGGVLRDDRPDLGVGGAWIDIGESQVHLIELPVPADIGQHFAIQVADLAATVAELRAHGVEIGDPTVIASSLQAFTKDPSGNSVELREVAGAEQGTNA